MLWKEGTSLVYCGRGSSNFYKLVLVVYCDYIAAVRIKGVARRLWKEEVEVWLQSESLFTHVPTFFTHDTFVPVASLSTYNFDQLINESSPLVENLQLTRGKK